MEENHQTQIKNPRKLLMQSGTISKKTHGTITQYIIIFCLTNDILISKYWKYTT